jgi:hypothetical protein
MKLFTNDNTETIAQLKRVADQRLEAKRSAVADKLRAERDRDELYQALQDLRHGQPGAADRADEVLRRLRP